MEPTSELIEALDREDIAQARRMTGSQKLRAGGDLFDDACRWTLAGVRRDHPGIGDTEAMLELKRRVAMDDAEWGDTLTNSTDLVLRLIEAQPPACV